MLSAILALVLTTSCVTSPDDVTLRRTRTIVSYGDSVFAGSCYSGTVGLNVATLKGQGWAGYNQAVAGWATSTILTNYNSTKNTACNGNKCGIYIFNGGLNDCAGFGCDPDVVLANMLTAIDDARTFARVGWVGITPYRGTDCNPSYCEVALANSIEYNQKMAIACAARPDIYCVVPFTSSLTTTGNFEEPGMPGYLKYAWECSTEDGTHLNPTGAAGLMAEIIATGI